MGKNSVAVVAVVSAVLVIVVLALVAFYGPGTVYRADTDTANSGCQETWEWKGQFADPPNDARKVGEFTDRTAIYYSWTPEGTSQTLVVAGTITHCGLFGPDVIRYEYTFSIDNGAGFQQFYQDDVPQGIASYVPTRQELPQGSTANLAAFSLDIDGNSFCPRPMENGDHVKDNCDEQVLINSGAVLRVDLNYQICDGLFCVKGTPWRYGQMDDEVNLVSALGKLRWSANEYTFGDTAVLNWEIPTDKNEKGEPAYFLSIIDANTNRPLTGYDRKALSGTTGQERFTVTEAFFSNDPATCQNRLHAVLYTTLVDVGGKDASVYAPSDAIFNGRPAGPRPTVGTISFDQPEYFEGEEVTVSWSANATRFHVTVRSGAFELSENVTGTKYSFRATVAGFYQVEVVAYFAGACNPSAVQTAYVTVGNVPPNYCTIFPDHPACLTPTIDWVKIALAIAGIVGVAVLAGLVAWLVPAKGRSEGIVRLGVFFGILVAGGAAVLALLGFLGGGA